MIERSVVDAILSRADIVEVVQDFVTLRKSGVNYQGLCPFHNERTPSFSVSPARQYCKCFSCGKGGNVIHFLMELQGISYTEAIKYLGQKYGIEVKEKESTEADRLVASLKESLFIINQYARDYFCDTLLNSEEGKNIGMSYFRERGFRDDIIAKFQLGYSPKDRTAFVHDALSKGYDKELIAKTGVCYKTDKEELFDRFHGRVIFPVHALSGKVVAFGGRTLSSDKKVAKYVNSPESEIYSKSNELYGVYLARTAIRKQDKCFLVEGYTDVISMHQSGVENVVASSGTSLTDGQIRMLHRLTANITVIYDGDAAGIKASLRGIDMLLREGMNIKVILLPDGDDPDSFARRHSADEFNEYIRKHETDFIRFKTSLLLEEAADDPLKRAALITDIVQSISVIPEGIVRATYTQTCSEQLGIDEKVLVKAVNTAIRRRIEEKERREERISSIQSPAVSVPTAEETPPEHSEIAIAAQPEDTVQKVERALIGEMLRIGNRVIYTDNDAEYTVGKLYKSFLERDQMSFRNPLHQRVFDEILEHPDFDFIKHHDIAISHLAVELMEEQPELSKLFTKKYDSEDDERKHNLETACRTYCDYQNAIISEQLDAYNRLLKTLSPQSKEYADTRNKIMQLSHMKRKISKHVGDRVVVKP